MERFKVFDNKKKYWVKDNVCISQNGDVFDMKKMPFGTYRLSKAQDGKYTIYHSVDLFDMHGTRIYEGDVLKLVNSDVCGVVAYAEQHASFYMFHDEESLYYPLSDEACKQLEIIGHVRQSYGSTDRPYLVKRSEAK